MAELQTLLTGDNSNKPVESVEGSDTSASTAAAEAASTLSRQRSWFTGAGRVPNTAHLGTKDGHIQLEWRASHTSVDCCTKEREFRREASQRRNADE